MKLFLLEISQAVLIKAVVEQVTEVKWVWGSIESLAAGGLGGAASQKL